MITILEGPDFAGKSTLAASGEFGRVIHNGPPQSSVTNLAIYYQRQLLNIDPREDVVFDRLWAGELIYGPIFRGSSRLTWGDHLELLSLAKGLGARLVHVDADDKTLLERFRGTRGDDLVDNEDKLMRIAHQYRIILRDWERYTT